MKIKEFAQRSIEAIDNYANPILVKEIRQAIHSNVFLVLFIFLLLVNIIICLVGTVQNIPIEADEAFGKEMFVGLCVAYGVLSILVLPLISMKTMEREKSSYTFEVLKITELSTGSIVRGKLSSVFVQLILYMSAFFPFMMFTYLARGITVFQIIAGFIFITFVSAWVIMTGLVIGSFSDNKLMKAVVTLIGVFSFFALGIMTVTILSDTDFFTRIPGVGMILSSTVFLMLYVFSFIILHLIAVNQLSSRVVNCSRGFRITSILFTLISIAGLFALYPFFSSHYYSYDKFCIGTIIINIIWWGIMFGCSSAEDIKVPPGLIKHIPERSVLRNAFRLLIPGGTRGYILSLCMMVLLLGVEGLLCLSMDTQDISEIMGFSVVLVGYTVFYVSLSLFIVRRLVRFIEITPMKRRGMIIVFVGTVSIFIIIFDLFLRLLMDVKRGYDYRDFFWLHVFDPVGGIFMSLDRKSDPAIVIAASILGIIGFLISLKWLRKGHEELKKTLQENVSNES